MRALEPVPVPFQKAGQGSFAEVVGFIIMNSAQPPTSEPHYRTTALPYTLFLPSCSWPLPSPITWVQPNKIPILPTASDVGTAAGSFPVDKARLLRRQLCRRLTLHPRIEDGFLESCPSDLSAFPIQTSPLKNPPASDRERSLLVCCLFENRRPLGAYNWVQRRPWGQLAPLISSRI